MAQQPSEPGRALRGLRGWFWSIGLFSVFVNILMLAGPIYMLQVYDRVLTSRSEATLLALTLLLVAVYVILGLLDHARGRLAARIGAIVQTRLEGLCFRRALAAARFPAARSRPASGLKDLEAVQRLLGSPVLFAVFDMPWAPLFLAVIFVFHPLLGWVAVSGGLVLILLALLTQWLARRPEADAQRAAAGGDALAEALRQQAETIHALGMGAAGEGRWQRLRSRALTAQLASSDRIGAFTAASKSFRLLLQSAILGVGAYLVIHGEMTAGAMIAASILLGRALAPVEHAIAGWPAVERARQGWTNLKILLGTASTAGAQTTLPRPEARLELEQVTAFPPEAAKASLRMLSFTLEPGQALGVIGVSASGKSTLARVLTGIWPASTGRVMLGGAPLEQYRPEDLGIYVGYLPQDAVLFDGTVAENIARLEEDPPSDAVVAAARKAGAHEMILGLPQGYDTPIAAGGAPLSGGQRQRIALARALYGDPLLLVLDEPDSNLDAAGTEALARAVRQAKADGLAVIVTAHRPAAIAACDLILMLENGAAKAFGPRDEILKAQVRNYAQIAGRIGKEGTA